MKPATALLVVCLAGLIAGVVMLAVPELSPAWSLGALALLSYALLASRDWRSSPPVASPPRKRVIFEKVRRGGGNHEEPQHEMLLRIVDARGSRLQNRSSYNAKRSRTL